MLFKETATVYCENHTEHTNSVRTSQETHYVTARDTKLLMLFRETAAAFCENNTQHTHTVRRKHITTPLQSQTG
jgi:hypothetical protein